MQEEPDVTGNLMAKVSVPYSSSSAARAIPDGLFIFGIGCAVALIYLLSPVCRYTFDTVAYALKIRRFTETGELYHLFHPHHLLFNGGACAMYRLLQLFRPDAQTLAGVQAFAALGGGAGVAALAALILDATRSRFAAAAGALALGGSFGWWFASSDGRATVPAIACLLWGLWAARRKTHDNSLWWAAASGGLQGMAILLHESHLLFVPVALGAVFAAGRRDIRTRGVRVACCGAAMLCVVLLPYAAVLYGVLRKRTFWDAWMWLTAYGRQGTWWNFNVSGNIPADWHAASRAFLARSVWVSPGNAGVSVAVVGWAILLAIAVRGGVLKGMWQKSGLAHAAALGLGIYTAFFTVWDPGYFVHWMTQTVFLIILMALGWAISARGKGDKIVVITILSLIAAGNGVREIWPRTQAAQNPHLVLARRIAQIAPPNSLVIVSGMGGSGEAEVYLPYFARQEVFALHVAWRRAGGDTPRARNQIRRKIQETWSQNRAVYLLSEAVESPDVWAAMRARYGIAPAQIRDVFAGYVRRVAGKSGATVIYRLEPGTAWKR